MKVMKFNFLMFLTAALLMKCSSGGKVYGDWVTIFNGKDLTGWMPKFTGEEYGVNYKNTFRIEDGKIGFL